MIWNVDETVAIPIHSIVTFEIAPMVPGPHRYRVVAVLVNDYRETIYVGNSKEECISQINALF